MNTQPNGPASAELDTMLAFAIELAEIAAQPALQHFRTQTAVSNKLQAGFDPVTEADRQTELVLREAIASRFPDHGILGEEHDEKSGNSPWRWVIDPIDGTRSFICGTPTWMTLIGLEFETQPVVGVASQPFTGEIFAGNGREAFVVRDQLRHPLRSTAVTALADVLAAPPDRRSSRPWAISRNLTASTPRCATCVSMPMPISIAWWLQASLASASTPVSSRMTLPPLFPSSKVPAASSRHGTGGNAAHGGDIIAAGNRQLHEAALKLLA
jgi:fructose-1,6-bisphosphatase/inositol monophosphatase family enzyme